MRKSERVYSPLDPTLQAFDRGLGTLSVDGELEAHLACVVGKIAFPGKAPWPWFVVAWLDGKKERSFEDYGPGWWTVRQLDAGRLEHFGPSSRLETRFLGIPITSTQRGAARTFDFAWLPPVEAAQMWRELGLEDSDF